jgi:hypothetical protein
MNSITLTSTMLPAALERMVSQMRDLISAGADVFRVMDLSRHRKVDTVRGYVRRAEMFKHHAGAGFM